MTGFKRGAMLVLTSCEHLDHLTLLWVQQGLLKVGSAYEVTEVDSDGSGFTLKGEDGGLWIHSRELPSFSIKQPRNPKAVTVATSDKKRKLHANRRGQRIRLMDRHPTKPIRHLSLEPKEARRLAVALLKMANEILEEEQKQQA